AVGQPTCHRCGRVSSAESGDVRRLGAVQEVAGREDSFAARMETSVHARPARAGIELEVCEHGELVIRDPVGGEHDDLAGDASAPAAVEVEELDLFDALPAVNRTHGGSRPNRSAV